MLKIVKAKIKSIGTVEMDMPNSFDDVEIKTFIKDNAYLINWKDIEIDDIEYEIVEDYILEEYEKEEPEDNTYSGGIYE